MREPAIPEIKSSPLRAIIHEAFGPPETWNEDTTDFILELHGIDPTQTLARWKNSLDSFIKRKENRGEKVPESYRELRAFLDQ